MIKDQTSTTSSSKIKGEKSIKDLLVIIIIEIVIDNLIYGIWSNSFNKSIGRVLSWQGSSYDSYTFQVLV